MYCILSIEIKVTIWLVHPITFDERMKNNSPCANRIGWYQKTNHQHHSTQLSQIEYIKHRLAIFSCDTATNEIICFFLFFVYLFLTSFESHGMQLLLLNNACSAFTDKVLVVLIDYNVTSKMYPATFWHQQLKAFRWLGFSSAELFS